MARLNARGASSGVVPGLAESLAQLDDHVLDSLSDAARELFADCAHDRGLSSLLVPDGA
jgi:hypothetical protein